LFFPRGKSELKIPDRDFFLLQPYKFLHAWRIFMAANPYKAIIAMRTMRSQYME
jgi:hypothetical protein